MTVIVSETDTPVGAVRIGCRDQRIVVACFADHWDRIAPRVARGRPDEEWTAGPTAAAAAIERYAAGDLEALSDLDVEVSGTQFQQRVWSALRAIPVGETRSYGQLAAAVGAPGAVRAVGTANGANPVWLVVPCHRVIRSDGTFGGYGGGPRRKEWLLRHEGVLGVGPV